MSKARGAVKLIAFFFVVLVSSVLVTLSYYLRVPSIRFFVLKWFYRLSGLCWGIRLQVEGQLAEERPLLMVSNHCSYIDVPVLGQLVPVHFTPKADVRGWPVIGFLCMVADCIFIDRRRSQTKANQQMIADKLANGGIISIFPEGTTNDGGAVGSFRSSYLSLAEAKENGEKPLAVQPVTVSYTNRDGTALSREEMDRVAWFGDAEFVSHLWEYLQTKGVLAHVHFHAPVTIERFEDRKALTHYCEQTISSDYVECQKKAPRRALSNNGG